ncbi:rhodanese-like domain-containing protein [Candidatus Kaiserbacteria bacterium]|nr:rhodanese-like domain-containing protein [Candidatus Kaiserbacteria bacterium]
MQTTISTAELKAKIDSGADDFVLVDTMRAESYIARHVPTAKNITEGIDFVQNYAAETAAPKDKQVIVYCSSETCERHRRAADALEAAGYTNVARYEEGLAGWQNAGLAFESSQ